MISCLPQSDWIRQNCATQMERVRDNYNGYKGIRQYGTSQLHSAREQYYEQVRHQSALVQCRFLKVRNRFIMPYSKMRNCESKMDSI